MNTFKKIGVSTLAMLLISLGSVVYAQEPGSTPTVSGSTVDLSAPGSQPSVTTSGTPGSTQSQTTAVPGSQTSVTTSNKLFYIQNPLSSKFNSVGGIVNGALEILSYVAVLFGVLMIIWVGLQFVLAQGKPDKLNDLKRWLLWIVIGIAVVIGARIIVSVVINTLDTTGVVSPGVIQNANNALNGR